jgi:hypothetical protein
MIFQDFDFFDFFFDFLIFFFKIPPPPPFFFCDPGDLRLASSSLCHYNSRHLQLLLLSNLCSHNLVKVWRVALEVDLLRFIDAGP